MFLGSRGFDQNCRSLSIKLVGNSKVNNKNICFYFFLADSSTHILHGKQPKTFSTFVLILLPKIFMNFLVLVFFSFTDSRVPGSGLLISLVFFI